MVSIQYTPFYPAEIADIINDGRPLANNIVKIYSQVKEICPRIPKNSLLYNTVNQMYRLTRSAAFLAQSCKFTCGQGDVTDMMDIPTPVPEPLETPETRRPRHPTSTATSSSQPPTTQPATTQPATTQPTTTQPAASQAVVASGQQHQHHNLKHCRMIAEWVKINVTAGNSLNLMTPKKTIWQ